MLGGPRRGSAYKTKLCALWQRGRCSRVSCNFAHGDSDLRRSPSRSSFPHPRGRRDYRNADLRDRLERRYSPRRRYSPGRGTRGHHFLHDQRPNSRERGSSQSRSPIRSERRHRKKIDDGETDSSGSLNISDNEDRKKVDKYSSGDEKYDLEPQLKQIRLDMEVLREDKSRLEIILDGKVDEECKISGRVDDLRSQLRREEEECRRMTSKMKKFIKAHARFMKSQEELKRSQARFERLADLLASDALKPGTNEEDSSANAAPDEDPDGAYVMSPSDQRRNHVSARKRSNPLSTREETKTGKKRRVRDSDVTPRSEKHRSEGGGLESDKNSKGTGTPKSLSMKKPGDDMSKQGNVVSSSNVFTDEINSSQVKHVLPSTGMAGHAVDDLVEVVEMEDKFEPMDTAISLEDCVGNRTKPSYMPPAPLPVVQNAYKLHEGDDEEVDVE